ncbi:hypothetical protein AQF52_0190 [Streptomyces venezuelae]|nr:hypothetical protein AQF52_0190 [Streptomyces venezuelae]CUM44007.1 hypothetical protein BN2537_16979 [Streptomyces venezuelae]
MAHRPAEKPPSQLIAAADDHLREGRHRRGGTGWGGMR